jgi:DNA mismatch repair protein MutS
MKQYNAIKARHPGALLLFRVGDFYETFGEDAIKASKVLDIVLTKRANGSASHIELAGFPHHALDNYLPKLVRAGNRVAICDQLEDPKTVKGIVKRGVTELVTPGLSFNDNVLEKKANNYLASIHIDGDTSGVAFLDVSTGSFMLRPEPWSTSTICCKILTPQRSSTPKPSAGSSKNSLKISTSPSRQTTGYMPMTMPTND